MYQVIERYRNGAILQPEVIEGTCATMADVKTFLAWRVPASQAHDWVVVGHGRTIPASRYLRGTKRGGREGGM